MPDPMRTRIDRMYRGDALFAGGFVVVLICVVSFVYFSVRATGVDPTLALVLGAAGLLVLVFNAAAIVAMIRQYSHEKDFIYGLDIRHLDEMRAARHRK